jgi:hypothetical protein
MPPPDSDPPALDFTESTIVFPDSVIDRVEPTNVKSIVVTNVGAESVAPTFALTSATDFTIESTTCNSLDPLGSCEVLVRFLPHTLGARTAELVATAGETSVATTLVGVSVPEPGLNSIPATVVDYGDIAVGESRTIRVRVQNTSTVTARPYTIALGGVDVADFTIVDDECSGVASAPNTACNVYVKLTPSAASPRTAQFFVSSGNLGDRLIDLRGNGFIPAGLSVTPGVGTFSAYQYGPSSSQTFTVTNTGTVPSPAIAVTISGTYGSYFALTDSCSGASLAGGASCMFAIVYSPGTVGQHQAIATVSAGTLAPVEVTLTGSGAPTELQITPSGWDFGDVLVGGTSAPKTFTVQNTGSSMTGALAVSFLATNSPYTIIDDGCTGVDLAPTGTCTVVVNVVNVAPSIRGPIGATLQIHAARGDRALAPLLSRGVVPAMLVPNPSAAAFGDVQMTETSRQVFSIINTGDLPTGNLSVTTAGADAADVSISANSCTGRSLSLLASCSLTVSFSPSHLGTATAAVELSATGATLSIPVTATGLPAPLFTVSPGSVTLNQVIVGESYQMTFVVQGTGSDTGALSVQVTGANAAEYAVTADNCSGQTLAADDACTVTVALQPTGTGSRTADLVVSSVAGGYRNVALSAVAFTQAKLSISPSAINFRGTGVGQTNPYGVVVITNSGQLPTGALTAQLSGGDVSEFEVRSDTCTGIVLASNESCSVHTQFVPTQIATSSSSLVVSSTPGGTATASLTGTGLPPPVISSGVTSHDFGAQEAFTTGYVAIRIDNVGGSATGPLRASLAGAQADQFRAVDSACDDIGAGAWCYIYAYFEPTVLGESSATLVVDSDLAGTVTIALTGTATAGTKIAVSPATHDFGLVAIGAYSDVQTFTATNVGQRDVAMLQVYIDASASSSNYSIVSTTCGTTLVANASCQADVRFQPTSSSFSTARLVFVENTLLKGEAALNGQTSN